MSENITHLAVCDDVRRLAAHHPAVHADFARVLGALPTPARLGASTRSADRWSADLIAWAAAQAAEAPERRDPHLDEKLAFVLGSLTHRAADRLMKPVFTHFEREEGEEGYLETSIHCDVLVMREVYGGGEGPHAEPFFAAVLEEPASDAERAMDQYFRVLWQRTLLSLHTFAPDTSDIQGWLSRLFATLQDFPIDPGRYARIAAEWDPAKVRRYLVESRFYDRDDALIRLARRIQDGDAPTGDEITGAAAATSSESSRYARILGRALEYLEAAGRLYRGEASLEETRTALDIGVPELAEGFVPSPAGG